MLSFTKLTQRVILLQLSLQLLLVEANKYCLKWRFASDAECTGANLNSTNSATTISWATIEETCAEQVSHMINPTDVYTTGPLKMSYTPGTSTAAFSENGCTGLVISLDFSSGGVGSCVAMSGMKFAGKHARIDSGECPASLIPSSPPTTTTTAAPAQKATTAKKDTSNDVKETDDTKAAAAASTSNSMSRMKMSMMTLIGSLVGGTITAFIFM